MILKEYEDDGSAEILMELADHDEVILEMLVELQIQMRDEHRHFVELLDSNKISSRQFAKLANDSTARWVQQVSKIVGDEKAYEVLGVKSTDIIDLIDPQLMESRCGQSLRVHSSVGRAGDS